MDTNASILICTDLDRTLLPNGDQPESPGARERFRRLVERPEITLAFVSGRRRELQEEAIQEYGLPVPDYSVCDVGTTIYRVQNGKWELVREWHEKIGRAWNDASHEDLVQWLGDIENLSLQEPEAQGKFKLSYFADASTDRHALLNEIDRRLRSRGVDADLIWSVDETRDARLLDILPVDSAKVHAVEFLIDLIGVDPMHAVYAGDSGNDLPALTSRIPAVLVANATEEVRQEALEEAERNGFRDRLYLAKGGFMGMNGNYASGALEGVAHFIPETKRWLEGG